MTDHRDPLDQELRRGLTRDELLRRVAFGGAVILTGGGLTSVAEAAMRAGAPKRGGTFRLGVAGGSAKDFIDGQYIITEPDIARLLTGWETLVVYDSKFKITFDGLAEEITPNKKADVWTIRVRPGIEFHNGKTLTSADVRYSLQRFVNKKLALGGQAFLPTLDPNRIKLVDKHTVRVTLTRPDATILDSLAQYTAGIVPVGYGSTGYGKANPNVGTGPFKLKSFTPGQQSVHARNPNYWRSGQPYFDAVTIVDFSDATAQVNGLLGGQFDAMTDLPPSQVKVMQVRGIAALVSKTGGWLPICIAIDMPPFDDVRVRQAMRLIVNRPQMISQVLSGYGFVGDDLYAPFDAGYDGPPSGSLPQREQDISGAKKLLKQAGKQN